jgi:hypothetical protein
MDEDRWMKITESKTSRAKSKRKAKETQAMEWISRESRICIIHKEFILYSTASHGDRSLY